MEEDKETNSDKLTEEEIRKDLKALAETQTLGGELEKIYQEEKKRLNLEDKIIFREVFTLSHVGLDALKNLQKEIHEKPPLSPDERRTYFKKLVSVLQEIWEEGKENCPSVMPLPGVGYRFSISSDYLSDPKKFRELCRHELYHIADGHCDKKHSSLRYLFYEEPKAEAYERGWIKPPKKSKK